MYLSGGVKKQAKKTAEVCMVEWLNATPDSVLTVVATRQGIAA
jgi:hypothetical protein